MPVYIGVDFHTRTQTVCWCDTATGECGEQELENGDLGEVRRFYQQFPLARISHTGASKKPPFLA